MAVGIVVIHMSILARVCLANKRFAPHDVFAFVITMASQTQLTWYGHAAFKLVTPAGNVLLIDPWLTNPVFEIAIRNGPTIYDTGDTAFFSDIARVSDYNKIDIMLVCIGDHFTMGPIRAADAVKAVNPGSVIPMHYGTFPVLTGTPEAFDRELKDRGVKTKLRVMKIGETITFPEHD